MSMIRRFTETFEAYEYTREPDGMGGGTLIPKKVKTIKAVSFPSEESVSTGEAGVRSGASLTIVTRDSLPSDWLQRKMELRQDGIRLRVRTYRDFRRTRNLDVEVIENG